MKIYTIIILVFSFIRCFSQDTGWQISGGLGISGVNTLITNNVKLQGRIKFYKKNNYLDNKFENNPLHSIFINFSKNINNGFFNGININLSLAMYNFRSVYFKEDRFEITFHGTKNDTINSPNWLIAKYTLPYGELGISRSININKSLAIDLGIFISYQIDYYGTSHLILYDALYKQIEGHTFASAKKYTNFEFNHINYGLRSAISIFPEKKIHPILHLTQSLMDVSKEKFHLNQHANIWALEAGLCYNFKHKESKQ